MSSPLCLTRPVEGDKPAMFFTRVHHRVRKSKAHTEAIEQDKMHRLEKAERDLESLQLRAFRAITLLDDRQSRNHWRESIEVMIRGGI